MAPVTPYFIYIDLFWPDGTRPSPNQIARVDAYDVAPNGVVTWEGQCGYDDATGGWKPVYMNYPGAFTDRDHPTLIFKVTNTAEQIVHTTQQFPAIASAEKVTITIGRDASTTPSLWEVFGKVTNPDGSLATTGTVTVYDITANSTKSLATAALGPSGTYDVTFNSSAFNTNGNTHSAPNLQAIAYDTAGKELGRSPFIENASPDQALDIKISTNPPPGKYRVWGKVTNALGLPVEGVPIEARHLAWTINGLFTKTLGVTSPPTTSDAEGKYEIIYSRPSVDESCSCGTPVDQINLLVAATGKDANQNPIDLDTVGVIFNAPISQEANFVVNQSAATATSEYERLHRKLMPCLGAENAEPPKKKRSETLKEIDQKPTYLGFVSAAIGWEERLVHDYVRAQLLAADLLKIAGTSSTIFPEVVYGLIRMGLGETSGELADAGPERVFAALVEAIDRGIVCRHLENEFTQIKLTWTTIISALMTATGTSQWQQQLLSLVLPGDVAKQKDVATRYVEWAGSLADLCAQLVKPGSDGKSILTAIQSEDLQFVFELYEAVGRFFPIVKSVYNWKKTSTPGQACHKIVDLAVVPEKKGSGSVEGWEELIRANAPSDKPMEVPLPPDVVGATVDEKVSVYARSLFAQFGARAHQERYSAALATYAPSGGAAFTQIATFLKDHANFSMEDTNIEKFLVDYNLTLGADAKAVLKTLQRVYRVTSDFAAAKYLIDNGYESAVKIASEDEDRFVVKVEEHVGGLTAARRIHRLAAHYASEILFTVVKHHQNLNAAGGATAIAGATSLAQMATAAATGTGAASTTMAKRYPSWAVLFEEVSKCACKECQTVFSPGAYMVDLLRFVDQKLKRNVFSRRPDLAEIEITCPNTNRMLPYIDLVNEVLEDVVAPSGFRFTYPETYAHVGEIQIDLSAADLNEACGGAGLGLTRIRNGLLQRGYVLSPSAVVREEEGAPENTILHNYVIEDEAWRFALRLIENNAYWATPTPQTSATNDSLEVFPEHFNPAAYETLEQAVFPFNLPLALGKEETALFLRQKQVGWHEIAQAFSTQGPEKLEKGVGLLEYLNLTASEASAILASGPTQAREYWGFPHVAPSSDPSVDLEATQLETILRPERPTEEIKGTWIELMARVPVFLHRSGLSYQELLDLLDTEFAHGDVGGGQRLRIEPTSTDQNQKAKDLEDCNYYNFGITNLNTPALRRLSFFIRLWRRLGWTMQDLDCHLMKIEANRIPQHLKTVSLVKRLSDELNVPPRAIVAWWSEIDYRKTKRHPKSLFDSVFLIGAPSQPEYQALERLRQGTDIDLDPAAAIEGADFPAYLRGALKVRPADMDLLWAEATKTGATLDLEKLTAMYRTTTLGATLGLSVSQLFQMRDLLGIWPFPAKDSENPDVTHTAILSTYAALDDIRHLQSIKMEPAQIAYLLRHVAAPDAKFVPSTDDYDRALRALLTAGAEIRETYPELATPDASALSKLLAKIVPAEKVGRLIQIIEGPQPGDANNANYSKLDPKQSLLFQYLRHLGLDTSWFYTAGDDKGRDTRYEHVYTPLRAYLVDRASWEAAIATASQMASLDKDTTDALLSQYLPQLGGVAGKALDDWKVLLKGGWIQTGTAKRPSTIENEGSGTWRTLIVIPRDGQYEFVATLSSASATPKPTLLIDGVAIAPVLPDNTRPEIKANEVRFPAGTYLAGTILEVQFAHSAADSTVTLSWCSEKNDPVVIPSSVTIPGRRHPDKTYLQAFKDAPDSCLQLIKAAQMVKGLALTKAELQFVAESTDHQVLLSGLPLDGDDTKILWSKLATFVHLLDVNRALALTSGTLFEWWSAKVGVTRDAAAVATLTGWKEDDIKAVRALWEANAPAWTDPKLWFVLRDTTDVARRLDLRPAQVIDLLVGSAPTLNTAQALRSTYRSRFTQKAWAEAFKPDSDKLRQRKRDALVGYLTGHKLGALPQFFEANDLLGYFLIDVEMEPDTLISRIKLALNAIQLYAQRVFWGLEGSISFIDLDAAKRQWEWMRNYRVWEANRKVFLYPENWIEPALRDDKTPFFKEMEEELLQGEISDDLGRQALTNYLEKVAEVGNPEVVASYAQQVNEGGTEYILHVLARTRSQSRTHFYRTFVGKQLGEGYWTPWQKVELDIKSDTAAIGVFNGRVRVAWLSVKTQEKPQPLDENKNVDGSVCAKLRATYQSEIRLMWSDYLALSGKWSKPRLSKDKATDPEAPSPVKRDMGQEQPPVDCYHLRVDPDSNQMSTIALIKTNVPHNGGKLAPTIMGLFKIWDNGHDRFETDTVTEKNPTLGPNWPVSTILKSNHAEWIEATIEGEEETKKFRFKSSVPFFHRTSETFRVLDTNMAYLKSEQDAGKPFFYETDTKIFFAQNKGILSGGGLSNLVTQRALFATFHHPVITDLRAALQATGPTGIMNRLTQALPSSENYYYNYTSNRATYYYNHYGHLYLGYHIAGDSLAWGNTQRKFELEYEPDKNGVLRYYPLPTVEFGLGTSCGIYNWELFFHLPMLVADQLSQDMKFEEAMNWYHFVFDPKQDLNPYEKTKNWATKLPPGARYWNFLPFFANPNAQKALLDLMGERQGSQPYVREQLTKQVEAWRNNPFNPHLIARQRIVAYQKNVFMKYLDNLVAWADQLFRQDTFESINQATQLYVLAAELLGKRPEDVEPLGQEHKCSYDELKKKDLDAFSNALVDAEYALVSNRGHLKEVDLPPQGEGVTAFHNLVLQAVYFAIPRNPKLDTYWDTIADRLFKIRNSMNIDGIKRQLALFEPPIDPALLVRAAAAGLDLRSAISQLNTTLPHYRFNVWLQKTMDLCNEVKSFGGALLAALEKRDGEALQLLRQGHEIRMLELARRVRQQQVNEAEANIEALERSKALAEERHQEYANRERISADEKTQVAKTEAAKALETAQGAAQSMAALFAYVPDPTAGSVGPFPSALINLSVGQGLVRTANVAAAVLGTVAAYTRGEASLAGLNASFARRWEDWKLQERLALGEIAQIERQIVAATIRRDIAQLELDNHDVQIANAEEVNDFLKSKFTNRELYQWMVSQLSRTFQQVYKLAFDAAKTAERAFEFELGVENSNFIQFGYMDNLRQGLLTGEKLVYDLKRMEVAYLERNKREYEITKPISLATIDGEALQSLRDTGKCEFELSETLFDLDFPGQYFRRAKAVRLSIPCVTGPHTNVSATLTLLSSATRKTSTVANTTATDYPCKDYEDPRFIHDLTGIQSIATSNAQNDAGLFELNFRDERYLPFEGAGVISRWRLELPNGDCPRQFDYSTISDVVMHLSYTAREGGERLKQAAVNTVAAKLNNLRTMLGDAKNLVRVFSLRKEFPDLLHSLLANPPGTVASMVVVPEHFPFFVAGSGKTPTLAGTELGVRVQAKLGKAPAAGATVSLGSANAGLSSLGNGAFKGTINIGNAGPGITLPNNGTPVTWSLKQTGLSPETVEDISLIVVYEVK
jgi:hypothetical protein